MSMNLYLYHANKDTLVGHKNHNTIPTVVFHNIKELYHYGTLPRNELPTIADLIEKNRNTIARDPEALVSAELMYRSVKNLMRAPSNNYLVNVQLYKPKDVLGILEQDPDSLCRYISYVMTQPQPQYHNLLLKSSPNKLKDYLGNFARELYASYPEFLSKALTRINEVPEEAYETAFRIYSNARVPELESGIFKFDPGARNWDDTRTEEEVIRYPLTPDVDNDGEYINARNLGEYGEYDSPWNLYVAGIESVEDRVAAIKQYGFKGRPFRLGYNHELR